MKRLRETFPCTMSPFYSQRTRVRRRCPTGQAKWQPDQTGHYCERITTSCYRITTFLRPYHCLFRQYRTMVYLVPYHNRRYLETVLSPPVHSHNQTTKDNMARTMWTTRISTGGYAPRKADLVAKLAGWPKPAPSPHFATDLDASSMRAAMSARYQYC